MVDQGLMSALQEVVGADAISIDEETRERLSFDALSPNRLFGREELLAYRADVVVRPATTEAVSRVVRLAGEHGMAVIPHGGGTGVMGAIVPRRGGIALDLRGMDRILEVQVAERLARVQPGVVLADLGREAERHELMLGHDPYSLPIATVGGAISTDSVGYRASKYGSMGQQVRALEVVLADGQVVRTRPLARASSGPALNGLFIGAEGTMGVITEATIELFLQPEERAFATLGFPTFETGFPVVTRLFDLGLVPALVDLTEETPPPEGAGGLPCVLYLVFEGYRQEVAAQRQRAVAEGLAAGGTDLGTALTEEYWQGRHTMAERWRDQVGPLRPTRRWEQSQWRAADYLHVALPVSEVVEYKRQAQSIVREHGLTVREASVWTDPHLFSMLLIDESTTPSADPSLRSRAKGSGQSVASPRRDAEEERQKAIGKAVERLLTMAQAMGGGMEYCHGIGLKLAHLAPQEWGPALPLARRLKQALDPQETLNPDKLGL